MKYKNSKECHPRYLVGDLKVVSFVSRSIKGTVTYLDDGGSSGDSVVVDGVLAAGKDDVGLAGETSGDLDGETTLDRGGRDEGRAGHGDEGSVDLRLTLGRLEGVALNKKSQFTFDHGEGPLLWGRLTGVWRVTVEPVATGDLVPAARTSLGKALTGRAGLLLGQDTMNCEASE